jgi:nucleotide-binding universal stress UspA family protein
MGMAKMVVVERILCPVDFSEFSARAYDYALSLARHYRSKLFLQHVLDFKLSSYAYYADANIIADTFEGVRHDSRVQLEEFAKRPSGNGAEPERVFCEGAPAKAILAYAETQRINLIVMGSHGLKGTDRVTLGSVAQKVLRKAPCSVLVVRRPEHDFADPGRAQDPIEISKLLVCTDFSVYSTRALEHAISIAAEYEAELTLLYVREDMPSTADWQSANKPLLAQLDGLIAPEMRGRCTIKPFVCIGKAYQQIIQHAREVHADAVIMGVRGRNALDLAIFGSTTHRVIQLGPCPVLAVQV